MNEFISYYDWLISKVTNKYYSLDNYGKLLERLYFEPYIWMLELDENRSSDGLDLRKQYLSEVGAIDITSPFQCSVLEMLIGLAERCEMYVAGDPVNGDLSYKWFWIMLDNLGLTGYTNDRFDDAAVKDILYVWLTRMYDKNGFGGLFPLRHPFKDQRDVETWTQLNSYFLEHKELY